MNLTEVGQADCAPAAWGSSVAHWHFRLLRLPASFAHDACRQLLLPYEHMLSMTGSKAVTAEQHSPPPMAAATYRTDAEHLSLRRDVLLSTPTPTPPQSAAYQLELGLWGACSSQCGGGMAGPHVDLVVYQWQKTAHEQRRSPSLLFI